MEGVNELFHYAQHSASNPCQREPGRHHNQCRGPGIIATDAAIKRLKSCRFPKPHGQDFWNICRNGKLSVTRWCYGDATHERYEAAIRDILMDDGVDRAIVILTPQAMTDIIETARIIPRVAKDIRKTILSSFMGLVDVGRCSIFGGTRDPELHLPGSGG